MEAGSELDALVAEKVMGWERRTDIWDQEFWVYDDGGRGRWRRLTEAEHYSGDAPLFQPSTDISAAWEVVETMLSRGFGLAIEAPQAGDGPVFKAVFTDSRALSPKHFLMRVRYYETFGEAICFAALSSETDS